MEIKRCARCGGFFETVNEVCNGCVAKDEKDLGKLKNYLIGYGSEAIVKNEVSANTGISMKNLNRFLLGKEFSGIEIKGELENTVNNIGKVIEEA